MGIKISDMPDLTGSKLNDNSLLLITDLSGSTLDLQNRKVKKILTNQFKIILLTGEESFKQIYN